jgi:hypothetical protein
LWTTENRPRYDRDKLRCPSVLLLAGLVPYEPGILALCLTLCFDICASRRGDDRPPAYRSLFTVVRIAIRLSSCSTSAMPLIP